MFEHSAMSLASQRSRIYHGRRAVVFGLGSWGGGVGAVRFLAAHGANVLVTDLRDAVSLAKSLASLDDLPDVRYRLGEHRADDFAGADIVVVNPAIPPRHPLLETARGENAELTTEIGLFLRHCPAHVIAVTGSLGKSTTATLIDGMLREHGLSCRLGGNIGGSLLDDVDTMRATDWIVLELSSFQLHYLTGQAWQCEIGVVTNFIPNHLDWHPDLEHYRAAKQTLLHHIAKDGLGIVTADDETRHWLCAARVQAVGSPSIAPGDPWLEANVMHDGAGKTVVLPPALRGDRRRSAALTAWHAARAAGVPSDACLEAIRRFSGLTHRMQYLGTACDRHFYNDSKATVPEAAVEALNSLTEPIVLLAGGTDKRLDLEAFACAAAARCKAVALLGTTAETLKTLLHEANPDLPTYCAESLTDATDWSIRESSPGDAVLLSPGCASLDWFRDYTERGEQFCAIFRQVRDGACL